MFSMRSSKFQFRGGGGIDAVKPEVHKCEVKKFSIVRGGDEVGIWDNLVIFDIFLPLNQSLSSITDSFLHGD